jgi:hypothetical protein
MNETNDDIVEVKQVTHPDTWDALTLEDLYHQKSILIDRWDFLQSKKYAYAEEILKAIHRMEDVIQKKIAGPQNIS